MTNILNNNKNIIQIELFDERKKKFLKGLRKITIFISTQLKKIIILKIFKLFYLRR